MATVGQLIDRTFREYLWPADDRPLTITLGAALTAAATSLTYDDDMMSVEEEQALGPGVLLDIWNGDGGEQILLGGNLNTTTNTVDIEVRGANGTTAIAHDLGDVAYVSPTFTRRAVFDAVADNVEDLWPELWQVKTSALTLPNRTSAHLAEAPADMESPMSFRWTLTGGRWRNADVLAFYDLPAAEFASGKAVDVPDAPASEAGYLTYQAGFTRPTAEADDLSASFGIQAGWGRIIVIGAAAQLLAGREFEAVSQEFLTEQFEQQNYPPGSATDVAFRLWRLHRDLLDRAARELRNRGGRDVTIKKRPAVWAGP